jgi:hypothetical protein
VAIDIGICPLAGICLIVPNNMLTSRHLKPKTVNRHYWLILVSGIANSVPRKLALNQDFMTFPSHYTHGNCYIVNV